MNRLREAALDYAAKGWPIFPVQANKKPYEDTNGVLDATTNKKQIEKWWEKWPNANIALDVAGAGMMVLDLDPGHSWEELEGNIGDVPDTNLVQDTPRGGEHLFFEIGAKETIPPSASKIAKNVDVRSFHSYVLLAPSKTKDGVYYWVSRGKPAYRTNTMVEKAQEAKTRSDDWDDWIIEPDLEENIAQAVKWLKEEAKPAIEGHGGDHLAYATAAYMKSCGLSPEMALDLMWEYWNPRCVPPWTSNQFGHLEDKVRNGYSYNTSPPGNMTQAYKVARAQEMFKPVSRDTKDGGVEVKAGRFRMVDFAGMQDIKPPKWLVEGAIPENSYSLLIGEPGSFKTFIALDMALSVATGAPYDDWYGPWPQVKQGPVIFIVGEGRGNVKNRANAWVDKHNEGEWPKDFLLIDPVPGPNEEDMTVVIELILEKYPDGVAMVVIDTVGRSMQGLNENSQQDASMFTKLVETFQHELDAAVLALHHTGHGDKDRARGSSVFQADADAVFVTDKPEKSSYVTLRNTKQKDAQELPDKVIQVIEDTNHKSLVAVKCDKLPNQANTSKDKSPDAKRAKGLDLSVLGTIVHQIMIKNKGAHWSDRELAKAIAVFKYDKDDERPAIAQTENTIRQTWLPKLRASGNPSHKYYAAPMGSKPGYWSFENKSK